MDTDTRKAMGINASKPINLPSTVCVEENSSGLPSAIKLKQRHSILTIEDCWRIDDEGGVVSRCQGYIMRLY